MSEIVPPELIHITWNAADAFSAGVPAPYESIHLSREIHEAMARKAGRLHCFLGRTALVDEVSVKIRAATSSSLTVSSADLSFEADYSVADEPSPRFTLHGDVQLSLRQILDDTI